MIYRYSEAKKRNVGDNMQITDLYPVKNMPMDFVIGELNGFNGTFCNTKNNKYYFILEGFAKVKIGEEVNVVNKGDFVEIPINMPHSIEGNVKFAIMCTPSFDIESEKVL